MKLTNTQQHYVQKSYAEFNPHPTINVGNIDRNLFTPLRKLWLSICRFQETHGHPINFCRHLSYRITSKSDTKCNKRQYAYNVTLRRVRVTIVAVEKR
jgi:hypothetical protein